MIQMHYFRRLSENNLYLLGDASALIHRAAKRKGLIVVSYAGGRVVRDAHIPFEPPTQT
jgi:hypothetical protein